MRIFVALALGSLLMMGCGDDNGGTGGTGATGGTPGTGGMGGGGSDLSVQVSWAPVPPCAQAVRSDWEITVAVTGEVEPVNVAGSVVACIGDIDMVGVNTIDCPNNLPYNGTVSVSDAGGGTDEVNFVIRDCMSGSAP